MDVTNDMGPSQPYMLTVVEAGNVLRLGKTKAYDLAHLFEKTGGAEGIPVVRIGRCLRVPRDELLDRLHRGLISRSSASTADELAPRRRRPGADGADNDSGDHAPRSVRVGGRAAGRLARRPRREASPDQLPLFPAV